MYWGIIGVSAIAFSCSTEFIPEINEKMRLVPFTSDFKFTMTAVMVGDYVGCYIIEKVLKWAFSDYKPKDVAVRRPDQLKRRQVRDYLRGQGGSEGVKGRYHRCCEIEVSL
jgi:cation-transporting ATPase 13A1